MDLKEHKVYIADLIYKEVIGDPLSLEEKVTLDQWLSLSEGNVKLYQQLLKKEQLSSYYNDFSGLDTQEAWAKLLPRISPQNAAFKWRTLYSYAAAMVAAVILCAIWFSQFNNNQGLEAAGAFAILPGGSKAMLYTSKGEVIDLESLDTTIVNPDVQLRNEEKILSYNMQPSLDKTTIKEQKLERLVTPPGGEYELYLSDGTRVRLNADSELKYPATFSGEQRLVYLVGEAYFDVAKNTSSPFIVVTKTMDVEVTGTSFNVMAYSNDKVAQATLVSGSVDVAVKPLGAKVTHFEMTPGMQVEYKDGYATGTCREVDVDKYIGWINKQFIFQDQRMEDILRMASRWYNVDIEFADPVLKDTRLTGEMKRFNTFDKMLELFQLNTDATFTVKDRKVIVKKK